MAVDPGNVLSAVLSLSVISLCLLNEVYFKIGHDGGLLTSRTTRDVFRDAQMEPKPTEPKPTDSQPIPDERQYDYSPIGDDDGW
ncbi:unnamed protein product [Kuraishia capsulata CBS 1993]|uniref:Uncharacterized protein n=1 Tax=Kuraishia capsulata CBS 1993 TaxID=1382522 RepID=W6MH69_9ASCO|nr:uncharacterized protein KUCA_T00001263001 [Kuraishia capsulata CBS 1993]CDK25296.1 unnamed protein product [Kuraishia capsulata CBS 1993]